MRKIALEEHFLTPNLVEHWRTTSINISAALGDKALGALSDFGARRLDAMDQNGVAYAVLSISGPGVQVEADTARAIRLAREANDLLAAEVQKQPRRYGGMAHVALQDPKAAADELERAVRDLGFHGVMVNGQTNGEYLDADRLSPFWERVADLDTFVYIHPANPPDVPAMYGGHPELFGPVWSWGVETATHALRLVFAGVFERYPKAKLVLGHMGEAIPFQLWRIDGRYVIANLGGKAGLPKPPSHYVKQNIYATTSGVFSNEPLLCALAALGDDHVLFSADYPFENIEVAARFMDAAPISDAQKRKVGYDNAVRLLKLKEDAIG
jgi:2,3-dihydroxybenzoate decarboxylase